MYEIKLYRTSGGKSPVEEYLKELKRDGNVKELAQIKTYEERLAEHGMAVNNVFPHTIRKLNDDVYELRPGSNRIFFFYYTGNEFVLLHAYRKHGQKAPPSEIKKAENERKDYIRRNQNG